MYWHGTERKSDIRREVNISDMSATYNISTLTTHTKVEKIEYYCGPFYASKTTYEPYFTCSFPWYGEHGVKYYVYTDVLNSFYFNETMNITAPPPQPQPSVSTLSSTEASSTEASSTTPTPTPSRESPIYFTSEYGSYASYVAPSAFLVVVLLLLAIFTLN